MTWNHRVVLKTYPGSVEEKMYEIHEVYYSEPGEDAPARSCTVDAVDATGETLTELQETLARMLLATFKPVLNYEDIGEKKEGHGDHGTET